MFKNLTIFRFPIAMAMAIASTDFDRQLEEAALKPVGPLELSSRGWVSPTNSDGTGALAWWGGHSQGPEGDKVWLTLGGEDRMLPGYVVNAELAKRLKAIEESEGRKPGGRSRKALKDDIVHELLPKAFIKPTRLDGYLDLNRGLVVVDTASRKQAEAFVSQLRHTLGSFPALPINAEVAPRAVLTGWIAGEPMPEGLSIGDEAILKDAADKGAAIRATRQELGSEEISHHLDAGKQVTRLGLYGGEPDHSDHVSFTLDEDLVVRKFKLLDGAVDEHGGTDHDDVLAELDARFFLLTSEVGELFDVLEGALKLSKVEA